jgi:hypothetical protein
MAAPDAAASADAQQVRHESQRSQEIVELLRLEMAALRKEFSLSRQMMPWQDGLRLSPAIAQLSMAMSEVGMPAGLRALLTDSIQALDSVEQAWPVMQSLLVNALSRPLMAVPEAGVHALCGPSGSGKTSMVGRLAYAAAQVHGAESQVMVSFADQRPGAWAQMQLLAAQSGVACFRATNSDMLRTLLEDLEGKTVWIDTCGTDFGAQAELLLTQHPKVLRHAVLPVDATVTSVQKILQNSALNWSSLMLSKGDEAEWLKGVKAVDLKALPEAIQLDLPDWLHARLADQYGEALPAMLAALNRAAPLDLRVNPLKAERDALRTEKDAAQKQLSDVVAERDALGAKLVEREVDALVGVKLYPAERDAAVELAKLDYGLFQKQMAGRPELALGAKTIASEDPTPSDLGTTNADPTEVIFGAAGE